MQLKHIMTRDVEAISQEATLREAADRMAELDVGFLPICQGEMPVGVITDRDIVVRGVAAGRDPQKTRIADVMTLDVERLPDDTDIREAARLMKEKQIRRVIVEDGEGHICGVVSLGDLAVDTQDDAVYAEALEEISRPAEPRRAAR